MAKKNNGKVLFTENGLNDLRKELEELKKIKRPALIDRIAKARDNGDLSENADYANAKEELDLIENRISELEDVIVKAHVVKADDGKSTIVKLGSKVLVEVKKKEMELTIVGEFEADPNQGKISQESPIGKALMGKKNGDEVEVKVPAGLVVYKIKKVN